MLVAVPSFGSDVTVTRDITYGILHRTSGQTTRREVDRLFAALVDQFMTSHPW
jgi:hypothetical protein